MAAAPVVYCLGDLLRLPVLRKKDIRENLRDLVSEVYPKKHLRYDRTSGATGWPTTGGKHRFVISRIGLKDDQAR
ncbi:MAG: hypothetical protein V1694_04620 [Candidatus Eisenbacteria bacterium]